MRSTVCAVFLAVGFLMPGNVTAYDSQGIYMSRSISCGQWLENDQASRSAKRNYVAGYMSAINAAVKGKRNFFENTDRESIILFVDKYCRDNPLNAPVGGLLDLLRKLNVPGLY